MAVFYRQDIEKSGPPDIEQAIKDRTQARLDALQDELKKSKDAEQSKRIKAEILAIKREFNRSKRFGEVLNKKPAEGKNSLDSISAADLMRLDKEVSKDKRGEFLSKSFLYKRTVDGEGNIMEEPVEHNNIKEGDTLYVDFGKNRSANNKIGAGHMLPAHINLVKIISNINGNSFEQYGIRDTRNSLTGYYSTNGRYIPVFTGDVIVIPKKDELKNTEGFKDIPIFENSSEKLTKRNVDEGIALERFIGEVEGLEKIEKGFGISTLLIREAGNISNYKERVIKAIGIGNSYVIAGHEKYSKSDLEVAITRLKKTLELIGEGNFNLNFEAYKESIAIFESGAKSYHARNDGDPRSKAVDAEKRAYGKYQFIPATLRGYSGILDSYGIILSRPPSEGELQSWLNNADAQEAVMDQYIIDMTTNHILKNEGISSEILTDPSKLSYYLALTHIGGPGALKNPNAVDYFGTSASYYSKMTWERYKERA